MNPWVPYPALPKQGIVEHVCNPIALEVEAGAPEIEGHPWLHGELQSGSVPYRGKEGNNTSDLACLCLYSFLKVFSYMAKIIVDHKSAPVSSSQLLQLCLGVSGFQSEVRRDVLIVLEERKHGPAPAHLTHWPQQLGAERAPVFPASMHPWPGGR